MDSNTKEDLIKGIILNTLSIYKEEDLIESYKILLKLLRNLVDNPYQDKYRTFKRTNPIIQSKVLKIKEILEILTTIGYIQLDQECLIFNEKDINIIEKSAEILAMFIPLIESKLNNRKFLELAENDPDKKEFLQEQKRLEEIKQQEKERLKDLMENHKEEVKGNWKKATDSNANKIDFGMKECKFEIKNSRG